ncbi:MAG: hypothetical protein PHU63_03340 [Candidatus ainarchaeum sp.]|nr:hypothetical protein [Candidatus ainarchaeum sp.]
MGSSVKKRSLFRTYAKNKRRLPASRREILEQFRVYREMFVEGLMKPFNEISRELAPATIGGMLGITPFEIPTGTLHWIPGGGCRYKKKQGGCTMCDGYGHIGKEPTRLYWNKWMERTAKPYIKRLVDEIIEQKKRPIINFSNASIFDPEEFPPEIRREFFRFLGEQFKRLSVQGITPIYACETRLEFITDDVVREMREFLGPEAKIFIGIGIESSNTVIREYIINKGFGENLDTVIKEKLEIFKKYGVSMEGHVLVGIPGLTYLESMTSAIQTSVHLLELGVHNIILMAYNSKSSESLPTLLGQELDDSISYLFRPLPNILLLEILFRVMEEAHNRGYEYPLMFGFETPTEKCEIVGGCPHCAARIRTAIEQYDKWVTIRDPERARAEIKALLEEHLTCECTDRTIEILETELKSSTLEERFPRLLKDIAITILRKFDTPDLRERFKAQLDKVRKVAGGEL